MTEEHATTVSAAELRRMKGQTRPDAPEGPSLGADFWRDARVVMPAESGKEHVTLRIDRDVLAFFRQQGRGYQTRINAVLRSFVEAHRRKPE